MDFNKSTIFKNYKEMSQAELYQYYSDLYSLVTKYRNTTHESTISIEMCDVYSCIETHGWSK